MDFRLYSFNISSNYFSRGVNFIKIEILKNSLHIKIQIVLDLTGGVLGVFLMMLIPSLFVIKGRKIAEQQFIDIANNLHMGKFKRIGVPYTIVGLSALALVFNFYMFIDKNFL